MSHALDATGGGVALGGTGCRSSHTVVDAPLMATQDRGSDQHGAVIHVCIVGDRRRGLGALEGGVKDVGVNGMGVRGVGRGEQGIVHPRARTHVEHKLVFVVQGVKGVIGRAGDSGPQAPPDLGTRPPPQGNTRPRPPSP